MFDVIHAIYEEDVIPRYENHTEIKDKVRGALYSMLYKRPYRYGAPSKTTQYGLGPNEDLSKIPELPEVPVEARERKPFIPATNPEDLPGILDAPLA